MSRWSAQQVTGCFGAELTGASLADPDAADEIGALLVEHRVLIVRDQHLAPADQVALARRLGTPTPAHPVVPGMPGFPEILVLDGAVGGRNAMWHTDVTFVPTPPAASVLVAEHVPPAGGDTLWADLVTAYETLAEPLRRLVDGLQAVHRITPLAYWGEPFDTALGRDDAQALYDSALNVPPVVHPVVRVHPVSGRKALFVNPGFTSHLVGFSRHESDHLLALLHAHTSRPEVTLRHRWKAGDVVLWDNRATMHYATDDYGTQHRSMRRVTIAGPAPTGPGGFASEVATDPLVAVR